MKKKYIYFSLLFIFLFQNTNAQISFVNRNDLLSNSNFHSGVAIAVTDMNGDAKDDIIRMDGGYDVKIEYQNSSEQTFTTFDVGAIDSGSQWSMCIADVDNNGFNEIFAGGAYNNVKVAMANNDGTAYTITYLPGPGMFVQGSNFADINNDGFVDAFACHDDAESRIWGNDGAGNLLQHDEWIDMATVPASDNSGNYGSVWTDFDNDGDIDLYIAKCRQGVTDNTDPRRINALFVNDGNGNYTEQGAEYGLNVGWQSWTADFQDVNNDGFLDCFITNHDHQSQLLINDGTGHYTEATNTGIQIASTPIQGVMRDFDNDGFVDILVAGGSQHLFRNNGDLTFTEVNGIFDNNHMESFALGDLNNDGFVDIYAGYANIYTTPSLTDDVLWMNAGNDNNHLAVELQGVVSNQNALGARIEIYGDWGIQIREVRSGESYGIMNSMIQYFGLGTATDVDSLIVRWPSGIVQTEYDVNINSTLQLIEGGCIAAAPDLDVVGATTFCSGESVTINAPAGYTNYEWSNGATTPSITVTTQGNFSVTVTDGDGCFGFSSGIPTIVDPVLTPQIEADGELAFCSGGSVVLSEIGAPDAQGYLWSNGETTSSITVTEAGTYTVQVTGMCNNFTSNSFDIQVYDVPDAPNAVGDTIFAEGVAELTAAGDDLAWYIVPSGGNPIGFGQTFTTPNLTTTTTFYVEDRNISQEGISEHVGMQNHAGTDYSSTDASNLLIFNALQPFTLDSVKVYTDIDAERKILLMDAAGNELTSVLVHIPVGEHFIYLGIDVPQGDGLYLTTDTPTNFSNLGQAGPHLKRSSQDVNYPYVIPDYVSINNSNYGPNWYYYFYDWKISTQTKFCASERVPVIALLDPDLPTVDFGKTNAVKVFPNPSSGDITIELKFQITEQAQLRLTDLTGKIVFEKNIQNASTTHHFNHLPKGVYLLQVIHGEQVYAGKIVIN
ncbi:MAG TPA: T9SS type A sorting domain-containing protein [Phaeodactylibacter sp.]|nr:T9SS type A sorting domain-containing protein [Phaeodactylibacter sp.]